MRRYLVVANQTLGGAALVEKLDGCMRAGPCRFYLVVPATPTHEFLEPIDVGMSLEAVDGGAGMIDVTRIARAVARRRLDQELARLREAGAEADGEVGDARALHAIEDVLRRQEVDEIIVSTLPHRLSRWMVTDLPHRARRLGLPVTHVQGPAGPPPRQPPAAHYVD
jgi:hypothetical protein